jgi:D-serine deaminase-like pyridoxal phosphate-dependent protein
VNLEGLKTPSAIVDLDRVRRNAERAKLRAAELGVTLRPHVKTHRCLEIARIQTSETGGPIMVSTLSEARFFGERGFSDITYGVPAERGKFGQIFELSRLIERFAVISDDPDTVRALASAAAAEDLFVPVFLKVDVGYHRCGVEPHSPEAHLIPRIVSDAKNLDFAGILTHAGHSYHANTPEKLLAVAAAERDIMTALAEALRAEGMDVPVVSVGSTPTFSALDAVGGINEFRCGNYIFFDAFQATIGSCSFDDCALTVLAAVVHRDASRMKIVVDAGAVALSKDRGAVEFDENCGYGKVYDVEGNDLNLRVGSLSQEHGQVFVDEPAIFDRLKVGARVRILANHSCLTALQHSHYNILEHGQIAARWEINRGW